MSRRSPPEAIVIALARFIAGHERSRWLDAMEAELDHLPAERRFDWALGSLVASIKDRLTRDLYFILGLAVLPIAAQAAIPLAAMATAGLAELLGVSAPQLRLIAALSPLPFAAALGALKPRSGFVSGLQGFAVYLVLPFVALPPLFGQYVYVRWEALLHDHGLLPPVALALWCAGAWLGARWARARQRRLSPPSP